MPLDLLRTAIALPLLFVIPGFLLVKALYPRSRIRDDPPLQLFLSIVGSVAITILVGLALALVPGGVRGFFQGGASGAPWLELTLAALSAALALVWLSRRGEGGVPGAIPAEEQEDEKIRQRLEAAPPGEERRALAAQLGSRLYRWPPR